MIGGFRIRLDYQPLFGKMSPRHPPPPPPQKERLDAGGVRHDPQRFIGKTVNVAHFNRVMVKYASRETDESKPGIKTRLSFLTNISEIFQGLLMAFDACYWLHKAISIKFIAILQPTISCFRCVNMYIFISE